MSCQASASTPLTSKGIKDPFSYLSVRFLFVKMQNPSEICQAAVRSFFNDSFSGRNSLEFSLTPVRLTGDFHRFTSRFSHVFLPGRFLQTEVSSASPSHRIQLIPQKIPTATVFSPAALVRPSFPPSSFPEVPSLCPGPSPRVSPPHICFQPDSHLLSSSFP